MVRTGDLSQGTTVFFTEDWARSSATAADVSFYRVTSASSYSFNGTSGVLYFAPNDDTAYIEYNIADDAKIENTETFYLKLTSAIGASIGDSDTRLTITDNDQPVELNIENTTAMEGDNLVFTIRATDPVPVNTTITFTITSGSEHVELVTTSTVMVAGFDTAYIILRAKHDFDVDDETVRISISLNGVPGVVVDDGTAIGTIIDDDELPPPPVLSLSATNAVEEGGYGSVHATLSRVATTDVSFLIDTWIGTANASGPNTDYRGVTNLLVVIPAGHTSWYIPIETLTDTVHSEGTESFEVRVQDSSLTGATLGIDRASISIIDTTPEPEVPAGTPLSAADLTAWEELFHRNEQDYGTTTLASIVSADADLSAIGRTLDAFGLLSAALKAAVTWFTGSVAYAYEEELSNLDLGLTQNQINQGLRMSSFAPGDEPDVGSVNWTTAELSELGTLSSVVLRAGDYVDGRLVIHQPLIGFDAAGDTLVFSSLQGRFEASAPGDMTSHNDNTVPAAHSFDWGGAVANGQPVYVVAPVDGYVVYANDSHADDTLNDGWGLDADGVEKDTNRYANSGFGNVITLRTKQTDGDGNPIFITFAHLAEGSVPDDLISVQSINPVTDTQRFVKAGQVIGLMGNTGLGDIHLHMQVGKLVDTEGNRPWLVNASVEKNGDTPPVYMMFGDASIAERHQLNTSVSTSAKQDYGFPIGDSDGGERTVAEGIHSTLSHTDVLNANPTAVLQEVGYATGGAGYPGPLPDGDEDTGGGSSGGSGGGGSSTPPPPSPTVVTGTSADDDFTGAAGDHIYEGGNGFDEVKYFGPGSRSDTFMFTELADGSVLASSSTFGEDVLKSIEGIWFDEEFKWYSLENLLAETAAPLVISGTTGDYVLVAETGGGTYDGLAGFDQIDFYGSASYTYLFEATARSDGGVELTSDAFGVTVLYGVESVWFDWSGEWYLIEDILAQNTAPEVVTGTSADDDFTGAAGDHIYEGGDGFDEVKYFGPGSRSDTFVFTQQADGSVLASSPDFGQDVLKSIEGIWFDEEAKWYSVPALLAMSGVVTGTAGDDVFTGVATNTVYQGGDGFDQIDYNGPGSTPDASVFTELADGGVQAVSAAFGTDVLYGVESVWFDWSGQWFLTEDLLV